MGGFLRIAPLAVAVVACGKQPARESGSAAGESPASGPSGSVVASDSGGDDGDGAQTDAVADARILRDLASESGRAELDAGGLFIDLGALDQHKYTLGGWTGGWGPNGLDGDTTHAPIIASGAPLHVVTQTPAKEIVLRGRGAGRVAQIAVRVDGRSVGTGKFPSGWTTVRLKLDREVAPGRHLVELVAKGRSGHAAAELDWLWLSDEVGADVPPHGRVTTVERDGREARALAAPTPRTYSFYVVPPPRARLQAQVVGDAGVEFAVTAQGDGGQRAELWRRPGTRAPQDLEVDLGAYAGSPVRLSLTTLGSGNGTWVGPAIAAPSRTRAARGKRPRNLILLLIDTARADAYAPFADGKGIGASVVEGLAVEGTAFRNAYNNENWTKPSIATLFSGYYPDTHGARWRKDRVSSQLVFLSEHLSERGFATAALVSNMSAGAKFGFDQGWDLFEKTEDAPQIFTRAIEWIDRRPDKPFFLYLQSIDPHVPFDVPREFSKPFYAGEYTGRLGSSFEQTEEDALNDGKLRASDDDIAWLRAIFNGEILYHDKYLGELLAALNKRGVLKDTAFVVLNDHGEEFGEHGRFGHGWTMGEALFRSPLIMRFPGFFPEGLVIDEVVEHVDVAPTLVDALGLEPIPGVEGRSLMPLIRGQLDADRRPYTALLYGRPNYRAVRAGDFELIVDGRGGRKLFNVKSDPGQSTELWTDHPIAGRLCEVYLGEALANPDKGHRLADRSERAVIRPEYIDE